MTDVVARYTLRFKDLASKGILKTAGAARFMGKALKTASIGGLAFAGGLGAAMTVANQMTAETKRLAESVGKTRKDFLGLAGVSKGLGLGFENVVDLQEEIVNKFGEIAAAGELPKTAIEGLKGLGFKTAEIAGVVKKADINQLIDKAIKSVREGKRTVQDVQSALDQLAGGEANKILGAVLASGAKSVAELNAKYERLDFLTKTGEQGAVSYTASLGRLLFSISSLAREGFGRLGAAMTPVINRLLEFIASNKQLISQGVDSVIQRISEFVAKIDFQTVTTQAAAFLPTIQSLGDAAKVMANTFLIGVQAVKLVGNAITTLQKSSESFGFAIGQSLRNTFITVSNFVIDIINNIIAKMNSLSSTRLGQLAGFGSLNQLERFNPDAPAAARTGADSGKISVEITGNVQGANVQANAVGTGIVDSAGSTLPTFDNARFGG